MYAKKNLTMPVFIIVAVLVMSSSACGGSTPVETQPASTKGQGQNEPTELAQEANAPLPTNTPLATNTPQPTPTPTPLPIGSSRQNPYPRSTVVSSPNWEVQVIETKRGDEAWRDIDAANMFNVAPPEGMEYILVKLHVKSISADNDEHSISNCNFGITGDRLINYNCGMALVLEPEPSLDAKLYTGGEVEGWAGYLVSQGENNLILVVEDDPVQYIALDEGASISIPSDLAGIMPTNLGITRNDPALRAEKVTTQDWELSVIDVVRGDDAWAMVQKANEYSDPAEKGMEYIAIKLHARYIGTEEKAEWLEPYSFNATGSANILYDYTYVQEPYPPLNFYYYPGGEHEGWIVVQVAIGESGIILVYNPITEYGDENRRYLSLE
jgi:hypothetical protein